MSGSDHIYNHIDSRFEDLNILVSTPSLPRPKRAPHCDCRDAVEAFFKEPLSQTRRALDITEAYTMVPTELKAGTTDVCTYCGYTTSLLTVSNYDRVTLNRAANKKTAMARSIPVIGVNLETGETYEFESAVHAYRAGHGNVQQALQKRNGLLRGVQWRRVK